MLVEETVLGSWYSHREFSVMNEASFLKVLMPVHSQTALAKMFTLSRIITAGPREAYCEDSITNWANLKESLCG